MKLFNKLVIFIFIILLSQAAFPSDAERILKNIKDKFSTIKDFSAELKQGKNQVFNGTIYYKQNNKFRIELKNMNIISDGSTIWNYNKKDNKVVVDDVTEDNFPFSFEKILNEYPSKSNLTSVSEGNQEILVLTPKQGSGLSFRSARLWINKDNLVERILIDQNNMFDIYITDYRINQNIPESRFKFDVPEGTSVIDLR